MLMLLPILALANRQLVELIRHSDLEPFEYLRDLSERASSTTGIWRLFLTPLRAVACPFCISHWTALGLVLIIFIQNKTSWNTNLINIGITDSLILTLAISALSNILNDLIHRFSRTPNRSSRVYLDEASAEELEVALDQKLDTDAESPESEESRL